MSSIFGSIASAFVGTLIEKLINGFLTYFERAAGIRQAKERGAAEQLARNSAVVAEAEAEIHSVQSEKRETAKTKGRLRDGTF